MNDTNMSYWDMSTTNAMYLTEHLGRKPLLMGKGETHSVNYRPDRHMLIKALGGMEPQVTIEHFIRGCQHLFPNPCSVAPEGKVLYFTPFVLCPNEPLDISFHNRYPHTCALLPILLVHFFKTNL